MAKGKQVVKDLKDLPAAQQQRVSDVARTLADTIVTVDESDKPKETHAEVMPKEIRIIGSKDMQGAAAPIDYVQIPLEGDKALHTDGAPDRFTPSERQEFRELCAGMNEDIRERANLAEQFNRNTLRLGERLFRVIRAEFWRMDYNPDTNMSFDREFSGDSAAGLEAWLQLRLHFGTGRADQLQVAYKREQMLLPDMRKQNLLEFRQETDVRDAWSDVYQPIYNHVKKKLSTTMTNRDATSNADRIGRTSLLTAWRMGVADVEADPKKSLTSKTAGKFARQAWTEVLASDEFKHLQLEPPSVRTPAARGTSTTDQNASKDESKVPGETLRPAHLVFADEHKALVALLAESARNMETVNGDMERFFQTFDEKKRNHLVGLRSAAQQSMLEMNKVLGAYAFVNGNPVDPSKVQQVPPAEAPKAPTAQPKANS